MRGHVAKNLFFILFMVCAISLLLVACSDKQKQEASNKEENAESLQTHRSKEDYEEAIRNLIKLLKKEPDNIVLLISLGNIYFDVGMDEEAIEVYKKALEIYPDNVSVRTDLGTSYRRTGQTDKALEEYKKSLAIDPRHSITRYNVGVVYLWDKKDVEQAIKVWEELLRIDPYFVLADEIRNNMKTLQRMKASGDEVK